MGNFVPYVLEQTGNGERSYDIFTRLLKDRVIFIDGEINDISADIVVAQILFWNLKILIRILVYISTVLVDLLLLVLQSMIQCNM